MTKQKTPREQAEARLSSLKRERASWEAQWRELGEYIVPNRVRLDSSDRNNGKKRASKIINSTPRRAHRILSAGMMSGITSPARPWFQLIAPGAREQAGRVAEWLHQVQEILTLGFARSNIYSVLHGCYEDLGGLGTSAFILEEDDEDGMRAYPQVVGRYALANSSRNRVDVLGREFSMTVAQLVERFGVENCSPAVQRMHADDDLDTWVQVGHLIEPNRQHVPDTLGPTRWRYRSLYFEQGSGAGSHAGLLSESGYSTFPLMAPRWATTGEDVYGSCPGMDALGDAKALQVLEKEKAKGVQKLITPPMTAPVSLLGQNISLLPGETTYVDERANGQRFQPAHDLHPAALPAVEAMLREHERRILADFFADLWQSVTEAEGGKMTAREVAERHEEKMLQLGPVLEKLQDELLDPLIARAFDIHMARGDIPPPPEEIQGQELRVEYVSILAQAQKLIGTTGIERLAGFVGSIAAVRPEVLDTIDEDAMVREYAKNLGTPPKITRSPEEVQARRDARAQRDAQEAAMAQAATAAQGAKTLSETDLGGQSALQSMLGGLGAPTQAPGAA